MALSNTTPSASNTILANITQISAGFGYSTGGSATSITVSTSSGTAKVVGTNVVFTASGGPIGPLEYVVLYDDTPTSPADPLVAWWDYGSSITLNDGETFTVSFDGTNGIFQIA